MSACLFLLVHVQPAWPRLVTHAAPHHPLAAVLGAPADFNMDDGRHGLRLEIPFRGPGWNGSAPDGFRNRFQSRNAILRFRACQVHETTRTRVFLIDQC